MAGDPTEPPGLEVAKRLPDPAGAWVEADELHEVGAVFLSQLGDPGRLARSLVQVVDGARDVVVLIDVVHLLWAERETERESIVVVGAPLFFEGTRASPAERLPAR